MDILDRISALLGGREQRELTDYLGIKSVAFSEWKSGKSKSYRKYLIEIAEFFDISIDYLVYGEQGKAKTVGIQNSTVTNSSHVEVTGIKHGVSATKGELSENETELLRVFNLLPTKEKIKLLNIVYDYEEEYLKNNS